MKGKRIISTLLAVALAAAMLPISGINVSAAVTASGQIGNVSEFIESSEDANVLIFNSGSQQVRLELCTERTVRIKLSLDGDNGYRADDPQYYMVQKNKWDAVKKTVTDEGDYIQIITDALDIRVQKNPLRVAMYDSEGNLISKDADDQGIYWNNSGYRGVKKVEGTFNAGGIFGFGSGDHGRRDNLNRYNSDFSEFSMSHGRVVAPFFMSTVGYGIFLNTIEKDTTFFSHGGGFQTKGYLDYFFMYGPDFKTILNEYAEITGRMELYGKWAHGFMLSKYGNDNATQKEFSQWINRLRNDGYPADSYVFDYGWRGDVADNANGQYGAGQKFGKQMWNNDTSKFPDIAAMFKEARELGFRVGLHNNAGTPEASGGKELYKEEYERVWVKSYMDSVITTGYGDWFWPDEFDVLGTNTAPTFSSKGAYEAWKEYTEESRPMFVTRGSYAGQHYATAWSGDIDATISELGNQIGFSIDAGLIGYWATSHDLGGFKSRPTDKLYTRWVSEFGAWNGIMRTHGHGGREPWTFDTTAQETLKKNLKIRYALYPYTYTLAWQGYSQGVPMMRAMLLEDDSQYNSDAWELNKQYYYGDWFLVAPALSTEDTVVSVWLPPQTTWYNYYTGARYEAGEEGRTVTVSAALDEIPVFVKAGAIVPMGPDVNYADEKPLDPLTLDIYPSGNSSFTLYEDDGLSRRYITKNAYSTTKFDCEENGRNITFTINERVNGNSAYYTPDARTYNLKFNHIGAASGVTVNGSTVAGAASLEAYNSASEAYWIDSDNKILYVKTFDDGREKVVALSGVEQIKPELGEETDNEPAVEINSGDVFELEDATFIGGIVKDTEWKGYTGTGFAKGFKNVGDGVKIRVDIQKAGSYDLVLRVNCGKKNDKRYDSSPRQGTMYLDNKVIKKAEFEITDVWGNTVDGVKQGAWVDYIIENVRLDAGVHTISFIAEGDKNPGNYNLDSLTFNWVDRSVNAFSQIEAETAAALNGATVVTDDDASGAAKLVATKSGAWAQYNELRGEGKSGIKLRVKGSAGRITVYETGIGDKVLATINVPAYDSWTEITAESKDTDVDTGNIFLQFEATDDVNFSMEIDWFKFVSKYPTINSGDRFELENGWGATNDANNGMRIDKEWTGYSGTGYVAGWKNPENYVEFKVNVADGGKYDLILGVSCAKVTELPHKNSDYRTGALDVNGEEAASLSIKITEAWGYTENNVKIGNWQKYTIPDIKLESGLNTVRIRLAGDYPGRFNLDYLQFDKQPEVETVKLTIAVGEGGTFSGDTEITVAKGEEMSLTAYANSGYCIDGWYDVTNGHNILLSRDATVTFTADKNTELEVRFYEDSVGVQRRLIILPDEEDIGTIEINGEAHEGYVDMYASSRASFSVKAVPKEASSYYAAYWIRLSDNHVSFINVGDSTEVLPLGTGVFYQPVYGKVGKTMTVYIDNTKAVIAENPSTVPEVPKRSGYTAGEWKKQPFGNENVNVYMPEYTKDAFTGSSLKVNGREISAKYDSQITLTAQSENFKCFTIKIDGVDHGVLSYESPYSFYNVINGNVEIYEQTEYPDGINSPSCFIKTLQTGIANARIDFTAAYGLASGYTLLERGILLSKTYNTDERLRLSTLGVIEGKIDADVSEATGVYIISKGSLAEGDTWYGRAYMVIKNDIDQSTQVIYADDILSCTYNG